jgi:hypothetical protein
MDTGGAPGLKQSTQSRWWPAGALGAPVSCTVMLPEALHTCICCAGWTQGEATATPSAMHHHSNIQRAKAVDLRKVCSTVMVRLWQ